VLLEKRKSKIYALNDESSLELKASFSEKDFHEAVSKRLRGSAGRTQESYLVRQGHTQSAFPRHSYTNELSPEQAAMEHLLRDTLRYLKTQHQSGAFDSLILIGHSQALGRFRKKARSKIAKTIVEILPKWNSHLKVFERNKILLGFLKARESPPPRWLPSKSPQPFPKRS
jgi:protein required for attachment to host cells